MSKNKTVDPCHYEQEAIPVFESMLDYFTRIVEPIRVQRANLPPRPRKKPGPPRQSWR